MNAVQKWLIKMTSNVQFRDALNWNYFGSLVCYELQKTMKRRMQESKYTMPRARTSVVECMFSISPKDVYSCHVYDKNHLWGTHPEWNFVSGDSHFTITWLNRTTYNQSARWRRWATLTPLMQIKSPVHINVKTCVKRFLNHYLEAIYRRHLAVWMHLNWRREPARDMYLQSIGCPLGENSSSQLRKLFCTIYLPCFSVSLLSNCLLVTVILRNVKTYSYEYTTSLRKYAFPPISNTFRLLMRGKGYRRFSRSRLVSFTDDASTTATFRRICCSLLGSIDIVRQQEWCIRTKGSKSGPRAAKETVIWNQQTSFWWYCSCSTRMHKQNGQHGNDMDEQNRWA